MDLMDVLYKDNMLNAQKAIFNKPLFILNNSEIIDNNLEFNITGSLLKNELDFDYNKLLLQYKLKSENGNISDVRNESCNIFNFNQSEYILECKPNKTSKGNISAAFSDLGDANLVVVFKNNENPINIGDTNMKYTKYLFSKSKKGLSAGGILAIIIACLFVLIVLIGLIYYIRSKKTKEINKDYSDSTIFSLGNTIV